MTFRTYSLLNHLFISLSRSTKMKTSRKVICFSPIIRLFPSAPRLKKLISLGRKGKGRPNRFSAGAGGPPRGLSLGPP